jgi:hypothetical protein
MPLPISGADTRFKVGDGATPTEAFTALAEVRSISGPSTKVNMIDTSSLTSGVWERQVPGRITPGSISFDMAFMPEETGHITLTTTMKARTRKNYKVVFPTTPVWELSFSGYVAGCELSFPGDDVITAAVEFAIDGEWLLAEVE